MHEPIRVAVLGYGLAGRVFHSPFVSAVPGLHLAAIVQRHGEEAAEAYPHVRLLRSAEEALADPTIDLIVVATPNETHGPLALAALAAGKHVVVDKPMAASSEAAITLLRAARAAGKLLFPFQNRRWDGDFLTLQSLLAERKLGRLVALHSQWDRFRPSPRPNAWKEAAGDAHGLLQDLGPHLLDQAMALFGPPQRLTASVRRDRDGTAVEDGFDITLEFDQPERPENPDQPGGHTLRYLCGGTLLAADAAPRFRVHGTRGSYVKSGVDPQEPYLVANGGIPPQLGSAVPWLPEPEAAWGTLTLAPDPVNHPAQLIRSRIPTREGDYRLFYAGVRDAILRPGDRNATSDAFPPLPTALDAWRVARVIELARESSRLRHTVAFDLVAEQRAI